MNNHIYQPMLFNPDIDIQTKSLTKINKYGTTKVHENMYIYESVSNTLFLFHLPIQNGS